MDDETMNRKSFLLYLQLFFTFGSEKEAVDRVGDERETKSEDGDDRLLEDVVDLMLKDDSSADIQAKGQTQAFVLYMYGFVFIFKTDYALEPLTKFRKCCILYIFFIGEFDQIDCYLLIVLNNR